MGTEHTTAFLRKRKFLLVLPLLILPFLTLAFWAIGGGSLERSTLDASNTLNKEVPGAKLSDESLDKMSLYNQARKDADQLEKEFNRDSLDRYKYERYQINSADYPNSYGIHSTDPNEYKVRMKLEELERMMNGSSSANIPSKSFAQESPVARELSKLEMMVNGMQHEGIQDPEIQQLNNMLETIRDIQNPELAKQKLQQHSLQQKSRVFAIGKWQQELQAGTLSKDIIQKESGFYSIDDKQNIQDTILRSTIPAVVHETQSLVNGAAIKLRLVEPVYINGQLIPEHTFISGICSIEGERLKIGITGLRNGNMIYPVSLVAYDLDAIEGIRVPGAISRDAAKEGTQRAVQGIQLMSLDPSIAAQTADMGIDAVKGLFGKKAKLIRVIIKAGYPLLLVDLKAN